MNNDLISREALKKDFEERNKACDKWIAKAKDEETKIRAEATKNFICEVIMTINNAPTVEPFERIGAVCNENCGIYRPQGEFTDLERNVIADAVNYLLGAELREENGYTEEVINALKSVLQKIGAEENHL